MALGVRAMNRVEQWKLLCLILGSATVITGALVLGFGIFAPDR